MPIRYFLSGSQTNVMPITCWHQSQTSAVCLMFQRGRNSVFIYDTAPTTLDPMRLWLVWVTLLLAAHTWLIATPCAIIWQTQSMEIVGDPSYVEAGKGRPAEFNHSPSHHCHPVITVRGSGGASRHNAISHRVSTKQKPKLVKISRLKRDHMKFHQVESSQNKSQNWSRYKGWKETSKFHPVHLIESCSQLLMRVIAGNGL